MVIFLETICQTSVWSPWREKRNSDTLSSTLGISAVCEVSLKWILRFRRATLSSCISRGFYCSSWEQCLGEALEMRSLPCCVSWWLIWWSASQNLTKKLIQIADVTSIWSKLWKCLVRNTAYPENWGVCLWWRASQFLRGLNFKQNLQKDLSVKGTHQKMNSIY